MNVLKRDGSKQSYKEEKVFDSCYRACLNAHLGDEEAKEIAAHISQVVSNFVETKKVVTSEEIFEKLSEELDRHNPEAAFLYRTHRDLA